MLKTRRLFSLILAATMILGGTAMAANAAKTDEKKTETKTVYAHELDAQAYDGDDLGAVYTKKATTFKVWAPTASRVAVKLYATGSSAEEGAQDISTTVMKKGKNGVWSAKLEGDKKNLYYTYLVTTNGITTETADVYAKAAGVNGNRSMIVDLKSTDPEGWDKDKHVLYDDPTDAVVWEVHVRDFSKSEVSGVSLKHRGKYLAFTESGTTLSGKGEVSTCVDYLKKLGITHVQLMPVYDYATIDESQPDTEDYNWGYDPKNYNVPEGSYSTNPFDGNVRINEFKQMIKALHDAGIGVIMDVVYNHTYTAKGSVFENTVPGYYFRMTPDGGFSDASACGDETASDHLMFRKYMIDSILYWINEYHIDGFRFDLMGIHDIETMNAIRSEIDSRVKNGKKIIMYGEPWTGGTLGTEAKTALKGNITMLNDRVGAFNDVFRDAVKGHVFNGRDAGFIQTGEGKKAVMNSIAANITDGSGSFNQPSQVVSYISAHDNFTLYDKLVISVKGDESFGERDEQLVEMNKMGAAITLTSQGISFMQAGEEFARTKFGDDNSFVSPDKINMLDWNCLVKYADLDSYYQGLIELRRNFKPFRDPTTSSAEKIAFSDTADGVIAYTLENGLTKNKEWSYVAVAFNTTDEEQTITLKKSGDTELPQEWVIVADKYEAGLDCLGYQSGSTIKVPAHSSMVLADRKSFESLKLASDKCKVTIEYKNTSDDSIIRKMVLKDSEGGSYTSAKDDSLEIEYDYKGVSGEPSGKFTSKPKTVSYEYVPFAGNVYTMTINYLTEGDELLGLDDYEVAPSVVQRLREGTEYSAAIKHIPGMTLNSSLFPGNALGVAGSDITVDYYYVPAEKSDLVLHYYNSQDWDKVCAFVYSDDGETKQIYSSEAPGSEMKADSSLGKGWYSITIKDIGSLAGIKAKFSDASGKNADEEEYSATREVWIKDTVVTHTGELNVIYIRNNGMILGRESFSGREGESYTTVGKEFENLRVSGMTENVSGSYTEAPVYVIYSYEELSITEKPVMKTVMLLCVSGLVTLAAAGVMGGFYRKKKRELS